jgi:hypothetical protein
MNIKVFISRNDKHSLDRYNSPRLAKVRKFSSEQAAALAEKSEAYRKFMHDTIESIQDTKLKESAKRNFNLKKETKMKTRLIDEEGDVLYEVDTPLYNINKFTIKNEEYYVVSREIITEKLPVIKFIPFIRADYPVLIIRVTRKDLLLG